MWLPIEINEDVSVADVIYKYTIRDFILGIINLIPGGPGIGIRYFVYRLAFASCGSGLFMKENISVKFPERIDVGENVGINEFCWLSGDGGISISSDVRIGPHVDLVSFDHNYLDPTRTIKSQGKTTGKITIEQDVWIGANVVVTKDVTIGQGAVVAAGSVVVDDVPEYAVVAGTPAEVVDSRGESDDMSK